MARTVTITYVGSHAQILHKPSAAIGDGIRFKRGRPVDLYDHFLHLFAPQVVKYGIPATDKGTRKKVGTETGTLTTKGAAALEARVEDRVKWYETSAKAYKKIGRAFPWVVSRSTKTQTIKTVATELMDKVRGVLGGNVSDVQAYFEDTIPVGDELDMFENLEQETGRKDGPRKGVLMAIKELRAKHLKEGSSNPPANDLDELLDEELGG